jgi:hypothetical protein
MGRIRKLDKYTLNLYTLISKPGLGSKVEPDLP